MVDIQDYGKFFDHLSKLNIDECTRIISTLDQTEAEVEALQLLLECEKQYYLFTFASDQIKNQLIRYQYNRIAIYYEDLRVLRNIRLQMMTFYSQITETTIRNLDDIIHEVNQFKTIATAPLKETILYEINSLRNLLEAKESISDYDYLKSMIFLTQARTQLDDWEKVIILKKYDEVSAEDINTYDTSFNNVYRFILRLLTVLIAKCSLYFSEQLHSFLGNELQEFGDELTRRLQNTAVEYEINYIALLLDTSHAKIRQNWEEKSYKCSRARNPSGSKPLDNYMRVFYNEVNINQISLSISHDVKEVLQNETDILQKVPMLKVQLEDCVALIAKVDRWMYLVAVSSNLNPKNELIANFINQIAVQIRGFVEQD